MHFIMYFLTSNLIQLFSTVEIVFYLHLKKMFILPMSKYEVFNS